MRKRFIKGELVASTNTRDSIRARRLIIEVRYNPLSFRVYKDVIIDTRTEAHIEAYHKRIPIKIPCHE
jgi:hypothetical protein